MSCEEDGNYARKVSEGRVHFTHGFDRYTKQFHVPATV